MPNPNSISDLHATDVILLTGGGASTFAFSQPLLVDEFATKPSFLGRIKQYDGDRQTILDTIEADGFAVGDPIRDMAGKALAQTNAPERIYVGRRDPGDADWDTALTAIEDEGETLTPEAANWFFLAVNERDMSGIEEISAWVAPKFALYIAQTADNATLLGLAGNQADIIAALNRPNTALFWHDPLTASEFGPAQIASRRGPFVVPSGSNIQLQIPDGGGTQDFPFVHGPATVTGTVVAPFTFVPGDVYSVLVDQFTQADVPFDAAAAFTLSEVGPYDFSPGDTLDVRADGNPAVTATVLGAQGTVTTSAEPYVGLSGEILTLRVDDSVSDQDILFGIIDTTAATVATTIAGVTSGFTVTVTAGPAVTITSNRFGSGSNVRVEAVTATITAQLGLVVGDNLSPGPDSAVFLDTTTATEAATLLDALAGVNAAEDGGLVRLESDTIGTDSRVKVDGGPANAALKFSTVETSGGGDYGDSTAVTVEEVVGKLSKNIGGVAFTEGTGPDVGKIVVTTRVSGTDARIEHVASAVVTALGFTAGAGGAVTGTGDVGNGQSVDADELAGAMTVVDGIAEALSGALVMKTTAEGPTATMKIVGGSLLNTLGISLGATASGPGVFDDFLDAGIIGRRGTLNLDRPGGRVTWDNAAVVQVFPDKSAVITAQIRQNLHARNINTFEERDGRIHFGVLLRDSTRYIDEYTTAQWIDTRVTEEQKTTANRYSDADVNIDYSDEGALIFQHDIMTVMRRADQNGHIFFNDRVLPLPTAANPLPTGTSVPVTAQQSQQNIDDRKFVGFRSRFRLRGSIHSTDTEIELRRALPGEAG